MVYIQLLLSLVVLFGFVFASCVICFICFCLNCYLCWFALYGLAFGLDFGFTFAAFTDGLLLFMNLVCLLFGWCSLVAFLC